jgi:hypothetical protein
MPGIHMGRLALSRFAAVERSLLHKLSKLAWLMIFGVASKSLGCWIDGLD